MAEDEINKKRQTGPLQILDETLLHPDTNSSPLFSRKVVLLAFAALGVVYGDIGTSPLYALQQCFNGEFSTTLTRENILGVLSLFFWSLTMVVSFKYLIFIMKADNHGEGGIFALLALIPSDKKRVSKQTQSFIVLAALFGAALLYGDGIITPTISVLSAIEGLQVATAAAKHITVPLTCIILFILFSFQKHGTSKIGNIFGPIMVIWFLVIGGLGLIKIFQYPAVLAAISPLYAIDFFVNNGWHGFVVLGSVVLCITGSEALYADMGHFGKKPIRLSWFVFVFPALLLNYFGQGALLLLDKTPSVTANPFYGLVSKSFIFPMVALSTAATVIASQALISGAFSLTRQAIQMGFLPRLKILHTSEHTEGQIYIPSVNKMMMIASIGLVIAFKESSKLASAYGIAVTANMVLTSIVYFFVTTRTWRWPLWKAIPLAGTFILFDITYFGSNIIKFMDGGWFPLLVAVLILNVMLIWRDGRLVLGKQIRELRSTKTIATRNLSSLTVQAAGGTASLSEAYNPNAEGLPLELLLGEMLPQNLERVGGTAVFMTVSLKGIPPVLLHHLNHNQVLHEQVILLSIKSIDIPVFRGENKIEIHEIGFGFFQIIALYGFMENANVPDILSKAIELGLNIDPESTTYYLGRESLINARKSKMMGWRKSIFVFLSRNAQPATTYFSIPPNRVVELGMQIEL